MKTRMELWVRLKVIDLVTQTARITLAEKLNFADTLRGITHYWYWQMEAEGKDAKSILDEIDKTVRLDSAFTNQNKHFYRLSAGDGLVRGDLALERDYPAGPDLPARGPVAAEIAVPSAGPAAGTGAAEGTASGTADLGTSSGEDVPKDGPFSASALGPGVGTSGLFAFDCLVREKRRDRETGFAGRLNARLKGVVVSNMKCGEVWRLIVAAPSKDAALVDVERMLVSRSRREGLLLNPHYQEFEIIASTRVESGRPAAGARAKE